MGCGASGREYSCEPPTCDWCNLECPRQECYNRGTQGRNLRHGAAATTARCHHSDDDAAVQFLAEHYGIVVIPGGSCGAPGCIRVAFANLVPEACKGAAARLEEGLVALSTQTNGKAAVTT